MNIVLMSTDLHHEKHSESQSWFMNIVLMSTDLHHEKHSESQSWFMNIVLWLDLQNQQSVHTHKKKKERKKERGKEKWGWGWGWGGGLGTTSLSILVTNLAAGDSVASDGPIGSSFPITLSHASWYLKANKDISASSRVISYWILLNLQSSRPPPPSLGRGSSGDQTSNGKIWRDADLDA